MKILRHPAIIGRMYVDVLSNDCRQLGCMLIAYNHMRLHRTSCFDISAFSLNSFSLFLLDYRIGDAKTQRIERKELCKISFSNSIEFSALFFLLSFE